MVGVARVARDIPYIDALIPHHHFEFITGIHLLNTPPVYVTPTHVRNRYFADNAVADIFQHHQCYTARRHERHGLFPVDLAQDNPPAEARAKDTVAPNNNFSHTGPIPIIQSSTFTINTARTYEILGINHLTNAIYIETTS